MDFSRKIVPLNSHESSELRKDFWQGWIGIAVIEVIGIGFSILFSKGTSDPSTIGFWFGLAPFILTNMLALYLIYQLINYWRDYKNGTKILVSGIVSKKYVKIRNTNGSTTLTSLYDRTRHFIKVNRRGYLIDGRDYEMCRVGTKVQMYVTPYGKRVYEIQFS